MTNTDPRTTAETDERDESPIKHVQTARIRYEEGHDRYRLTLTPAIRAAGLGEDAVFRFIPEEVDNLGVVPALGSEDASGHVRDNRTYSVISGGATGDAFRLQIPEAALDALGIDTSTAAAETDDLPLLDVYAGDRMIAFDRSSAIAIPIDALPGEYERDTDGESDSEEVILEQAQTTTPIMRSYDMVTAKLTGAVRQAANGNENELSAITYHSDLADDLGGGIVPATLREGGDGRARDDAYSLQRVASNSGESAMRGFEAGIPDDVLEALELSEDDYEDVPLEDRPALTVYAGDRMIALGRPGEREVAVDRAQTPGERAPSLTDIGGIGPALAERLTSAGYATVDDLANATREDLLAIDELGERRARRIMADVSDRGEE